MKITIKQLSQKFGLNLAKVRRWSREFLPPDPKASMRSGYARELTMEDAFEVFLGGHLVSELGFQVYEAKQIIENLRDWIKSKGLYPGKAYSEARRNNSRIHHVHIMRTLDGKNFFYEIRELLHIEPDKKDIDIMVEKYRIAIMAPEGSLPEWRKV
jgi:DNA-binding transcriptional MerR regulator